MRVGSRGIWLAMCRLYMLWSLVVKVSLDLLDRGIDVKQFTVALVLPPPGPWFCLSGARVVWL